MFALQEYACASGAATREGKTTVSVGSSMRLLARLTPPERWSQ
jgi:hypothetical protein